jgi:hypothetical protein
MHGKVPLHGKADAPQAHPAIGELQALLIGIYDLPPAPDIRHFLLTDRELARTLGADRASDEQLLVAQDADALSIGLYLDAAVLARLHNLDPMRALTSENLADYLTVAEGVSHFVYLAWNAAFDKPVSLLELELQGEVDKYVAALWLLRRQGSGRFPHELHRALFERTRIDAVAAGERHDLYRTASRYAARYCRRVAARLEFTARAAASETVAELRRFYRWGNARKLRHIEQHA